MKSKEEPKFTNNNNKKSKIHIFGKKSYEIINSVSLYLDGIKRKFKYNKKYRNFGRITKIIVVFLGLYLILYPIIPGIFYKIFYKGNQYFPYNSVLQENDINKEGDGGRKKIPSGNRLVIPSINVDMPIIEGENDSSLDLGVWHRPNTGIPGEGNMVLTGHRVGYEFLPDKIRNSTSFYNLDKLSSDDYVIIYWEGEEYDYKVSGREIVDQTATYIEEQTEQEKLTLYTCHPLGQNSKRLVYYAERYNND